MNPITHHTNNKVFKAPESWPQNGPQGQCLDLAVTMAMLYGVPHVVSFWRPTPAELEALNAGGAVSLWIVGEDMPPVMLSAESIAEQPIN